MTSKLKIISHYLAIGLATLYFFLQCDAQPTQPSPPDPNFPLVFVPDEEATIDATLQKTYVTTVGLVPVSATSQFNPQTFETAASPFYSSGAGLPGYVGIDTITSNPVSPTLLLVTYHVIYTLVPLQQMTDDDVKSSIGNYQQVSSNVGSSTHLLFSFYIFEDSDVNFRFSGNSICNQPTVSCNSSLSQCSETLDGVSVLCKSPCKLEYCKNNGTCAQADARSEPTCTCLSKADVYYLGANCQTLVALWMVILVVVGCFFLIVAAVVIACCVYAAKRRRKEKESEEHGIEDVKAFTNKGYLYNEKNAQPDIIRNGFQEREVVTSAVAAAPRRRSRTPSDGRNHSYRRHQRSDYSRRRRRSDSYDRHRRRHSTDTTTSNSSVSSYNNNDSFDDSSNEATTTAHSLSFPMARSDSTSGSSSVAVKRTSNATSNQANLSADNDVDIDVRDQGTSPIRWNPTPQPPKTAPSTKLGKIDIAERKGWMPSLGPQMFELETGNRNKTTLPSSSGSDEYPTQFVADTDI